MAIFQLPIRFLGFYQNLGILGKSWDYPGFGQNEQTLSGDELQGSWAGPKGPADGRFQGLRPRASDVEGIELQGSWTAFGCKMGLTSGRFLEKELTLALVKGQSCGI